MRKIVITFSLIILSLYVFSQNGNQSQNGNYLQNGDEHNIFWKLNSLHGDINVNGAYWDQKTNRGEFNERTKNSIISQSIFLYSRSFFWHPNFLSLDLDAGYSPETGQRLSLVTPDRNETNTLKKLHAKALFFQNNAVNLSVFGNLNDSYSNRENLTNLKSNFKNWGSTLNYFNKVLPLSFSYTSSESKQKETDTDRSYTSNQNSFVAKTEKSFGGNDWHELIFSHNEYKYENLYLILQQGERSNIVKNKINSWNLYNRMFFDKKRNYSLNSRILYDDQNGDFEFSRFQVLENVNLRLPKEFYFAANYDYCDLQREIQESQQHNARGVLSHQLFESLRTSVSYEFNTINANSYDEQIQKAGFDIRYVKKIPINGLLTLSYSYNNSWQDRNSDDADIFILKEQHALTDGQQVLLNNQFVDLATVVVTDITSTITYTLNLDYVLLQIGQFVEIQRIPGGQIPNNGIVLIDYMAKQPLSYQFNAINKYFGSSISFFRNSIEFYYNTTKQDYIDPTNVEFLTLNYYKKNVIGARFRYKIFKGGIEYDDYNSRIIPHELYRYYLSVHGNVSQDLLFSIEGNLSDYHLIVEEGQKQKFYNISGLATYILTPNTRLNLETGYRKQEGDQQGINLELITSRLEITSRYRKLYFTTGIEFYNKEISNEDINFKKATIQISRKF